MKTTLILLSCIAFAGCSPVGPDYEGAPELDREDRFANAALSQSAPTLDRWWRSLRDPSLNRLVDAVLANNRDLLIARERVREARALRKQAGAAILPQGTGKLSYTRLDFTGDATASDFLTSPLEFWTAGADVSWEADVFGGRRRAVQSAEARAQAAQEALHAVRLALASETVEAYFTLAGLAEQLSQVEKQVRGQEAQLADLRAREAAGAASKLDLDRARSRLEVTRAQAPSLRAGIEGQRRRLLVLRGSARGGQLPTRSTLPAKLPMIRSGLPADLITRRPDLRQAERELAAATADIGVATANFYPRFSILGSPSGGGFGNLFDAVGFNLQLNPSVTWSLFSGGRNRALLEAADARQKQALYRYERVVIGALHEVEAELSALRQETARLAIVQRARQATARSLQRVRETRDAGAIDPIDVLVEEERLRDAEIAEIRVKSQLILVWTRLHKALGGGWK